jgi:hypothetical protein
MAEQKNKTRAKVLQFLRKYKQRAGCRLCGENSSADVLDFHHERHRNDPFYGFVQYTGGS